MKWLTTVFAVYVLGLSLWPCADEALPLVGQELATVFITATPDVAESSSNEHEHHHDQCSPFCTCACCAIVATVTPLFTYSTALASEPGWLPVIRFHYALTNWAEPLTAIWQPPKLTV
ncbi:hypothetical protein [Spirosoma sp. KUDC1026]|uniref:hypothetical protein n=1 Tax=Spirosoma sp. KUDC1026 TaxID=2745947 RepID=UPI00159B8F3F|nr:hypothetical protein [Spirosoma sp. KUDC1026]QKZ14078.1 hypothetical protein HU175_16155 [Spirosoma sp. KUDC1026]